MMAHDAEGKSNNQELRTYQNVNMPIAYSPVRSPPGSGRPRTNSIPTRLQISPSPPFRPSLGISINYNPHPSVPVVPNLSIGSAHNIPVPGSPVLTPLASSDIGQDSSIFANSSPYLRATKSAVDNAIANERDRIASLEEQEAGYTTIEQFKIALKKERQHSRHLVTELAGLKSIAVASTLEAEVNEEGRINCLMRRLDGLQKEKGRIIVELEREEEMVSFYFSVE